MSSKFIQAIWVPSQEFIEAERDWIVRKIQEIGDEKLHELAGLAKQARERAYQPYSGYSVGAAVMFTSGHVSSAPNTEVVTYSQTGHAESNAIAQAIGLGEGRKRGSTIEVIVISHQGETMPCGACRQEILEHCGENALVIDTDENGKPTLASSQNLILPLAFGPRNLEE